jgi:putative oxidoreductase
MEWLIDYALPVVAKFFLVVLFPFSALDKIVNWKAALEQANSSFLPGGSALLVLAMIVEFVTPICIVVGWYEGWAALILAFFCVITAILYHNFWAYPRFWSPNSEGRAHVWDFLKNFGLAGGLLLVVLKSELPPELEHAVEPASFLTGGQAQGD